MELSIAQIIKYEGDNSTFVWKHPSEDFNTSTQLIVHESQEAIFFIEEAKKMMVEGTVDVSGSTVKVDNERKIENLRTLADRAKAEGDTETAAKYFEELLKEDPNNWEANFYTIYYAAHNIKIAQIGSAANRVSNIIDTVYSLIKENLHTPDEQKAAGREVAYAVANFSRFRMRLIIWEQRLKVLIKQSMNGWFLFV